MALTPEEIKQAAEAQARLNNLVAEYNRLTGQNIPSPISSDTIKNTSDYNKLMAEINAQTQKFTSLSTRGAERIIDRVSELNSTIEKYNKLTGLARKNQIDPSNYKTAEEYQKALNKEISRYNGLLLNADSGLDSILSRFQDIGAELKAGFGNSTKQALKSVNSIYSLTEQLADAQTDLSTVNKKDLELLKKKAELEFDRLDRHLKGLETAEKENDLSKDRVLNDLKNGKITEAQATARLAKLTQEGNKISELKDLAEQRNKEFKEQNGLIEDINNAFDETIKRVKNINDATGLTGKLLEGAGGALEKIGFKGISDKVKDINEDLKRQAINITANGKNVATLGQKFSLLKTGVVSVGSALTSAIKDPLIQIAILTKAFKVLVDIGMHASQAATDLGRELGKAGKNATEAYHQIYKMAVASNDAFSNAKEFAKANNELNKSLGTSVVFSQDQLEVQTMLTKQMGLSGEQAAQVARFGQLNGQTSEQVVDSVLKQTDGLINSREVMEEVASVSADTAALYKNNPGLIAKAVMKVKELGMSMQQAKNISSGLLDFESSIEAEMEAQLITGKQMNLNRARELALQGKTAEAAEEARKQIGSYEDFMKAGPIGQQAMAKALGMSTEELGKQLQTTESIAKMRKDPKYAGLSNEQLTQKAMRENMSASERLADTMTSIKETFASLIEGPLATAVEMASKAFKGIADSPIGKLIVGGAGVGLAVGAVAGTVYSLYKMMTGFIKNLLQGKVGDTETRPNISKETAASQDSLASKIGKSVADNIPAGGAAGGEGGLAGELSDSVEEYMGGGSDDDGYYDKQGRYRDKKTGKYKKKPQAQGKPGTGGKTPSTKTPKAGKTPSTKTPKAGKMPKAKTPKIGAKMLKGLGGMGGAAMGALNFAAQAAPVAMSTFGRGLESQGAETGNRTKETIGSSMAQAGDVGVAKQSVGLLGGIGNMLSKLNPTKMVTGALSKYGGKFLKAIPTIAKKIPLIGAAIEGIFAAKDIAGMMSSGMPEDDIYQNIGRRALQAIGGILGGAGGSLAIQAANIVPGLGVILTPLAGLAGDFIGRSLGGLLADASPSLSQTVGKGISDLFGQTSKIKEGDKIQNAAGDVAKSKGLSKDAEPQGQKTLAGSTLRAKYVDEKSQELKKKGEGIKSTPSVALATGGIVSKPTTALVGEAGSEAVVPLDQFYKKFDELISEIRKGGNVYIDGNKAGEALVLGSYKSA